MLKQVQDTFGSGAVFSHDGKEYEVLVPIHLLVDTLESEITKIYLYAYRNENHQLKYARVPYPKLDDYIETAANRIANKFSKPKFVEKALLKGSNVIGKDFYYGKDRLRNIALRLFNNAVQAGTRTRQGMEFPADRPTSL